MQTPRAGQRPGWTWSGRPAVGLTNTNQYLRNSVPGFFFFSFAFFRYWLNCHARGLNVRPPVLSNWTAIIKEVNLSHNNPCTVSDRYLWSHIPHVLNKKWYNRNKMPSLVWSVSLSPSTRSPQIPCRANSTSNCVKPGTCRPWIKIRATRTWIFP